MKTLLGFAGRNGPLLLFFGVLIGLVVPPLAAAAKPWMGASVFVFTLGSFLKVDGASLRAELHRSARAAVVLGWTLFGVPLLAWILCQALAFPPHLTLAIDDGKPTGGRYKREFGVPQPTAQENFTDPDSRIMKRAGGGFDASYNAQTGVDDTAHIIVAAELSNNAGDVGQLVPMLQAVAANTDQAPEQALADAGYRSEHNFEALAGSSTELVVVMGREGKRCAEVDAKSNPHTAAMAAKLRSDQGRAAYRRRKWIAEPPNGWIKSVLGFRQFSLRGLHRVQAEFKLVCLALNLRRMSALQAR